MLEKIKDILKKINFPREIKRTIQAQLQNNKEW